MIKYTSTQSDAHFLGECTFGVTLLEIVYRYLETRDMVTSKEFLKQVLFISINKETIY